MIPTRFLSKTRLIISIVSGFSLLLLFIIWFQLSNQLKSDKQHALDTAIQNNTNLVISLEQYAIRTIRNADALLQLIKMQYEVKGKETNLQQFFEKGVIEAKDFNGVAIIDTAGNFLITDLKMPGNNFPNLADREYFNYHKTHKDGLYVGKPVQSRTINDTVITVSRRINRKDGSFGGVVVIQIKPSVFTSFYAKASLNPHDIISLISPDGITYARRTGNKESHSENISKSPLFTHVAKKTIGNYFARDAIKGIPTYFSYRRLEGYPVIATTGKSEEDVLAEYVKREKETWAFGVSISLLLGLFAVLVCIFFIDRKKYIGIIADSELRYRSIFENCRDAIILVDLEGRIVAMNRAGHNLFGVQNQPAEFFHQLYRSSEPMLQLQHDVPDTMHLCPSEIRFYCHSGKTFSGEIIQSSYNDTKGGNKFIIQIRDISLRKEMERRLRRDEKRYQRIMTKQIIAAQEREREAIGYELHDNVNQILTTVKLYLETGLQFETMRKELLTKSIHHINDTICEIRSLSHMLSAPTLGTKSLIDSVKALIEMVAYSGRINIDFSYKDYHTPIEKEQKLAVYRILQEQLNNIIKHAKATQVDITIGQDADKTMIVIKDNGIGFDKEKASVGIGFSNMLSRTKVFGGDMHIQSEGGDGCRVEIFIPIKMPEEVE